MRSMLTTTCVLLSLAFTLCAAGDYERNDPSNSRNAKILDYQFENIGTGPYHFAFATSDGTERREEGNLVNANTEDEALVVKGSYSYVGPDGITYSVRYVADENGFHPEGDHIKVPPFVPWDKHQRHQDHDKSGHYHHQPDPQTPTQSIYGPRTQTERPLFPSPSPVYGSSNTQKPLIAQYFPNQVGASTPRPQAFNPFREQPALIAYLPTRRDLRNNEENGSYQSTNVANSIIEILGASEKDEKPSSVKIEDINSL